MRSRALILVIFAWMLLPPHAAQAGVSVRFINPERYTDADSYGPRSYQFTEVFIRKYLEDLGRALLRPGQDLAIDVLNIDLAGTSKLTRGGYDLRVMRDITPPSFRLRYVLKEKGRPPRSGEETVTDLTYRATGFASERFGYEKTLLRDWFRRRLGSERSQTTRAAPPLPG
jgi:hypothetical protein